MGRALAQEAYSGILVSHFKHDNSQSSNLRSGDGSSGVRRLEASRDQLYQTQPERQLLTMADVSVEEGEGVVEV